MDWNNNGHLDVQDLILTDLILEEEEKSKSDNDKPTGCCGPTVAMLLLLFVSPIVLVGIGIYNIIQMI